MRERRPDSKQVTASESLNLVGVSERGSHDDGLVVKLLVVVVDLSNALHAGVLQWGEGFLICVLHVPVVDSSHEGRDESYSCFSAGHCLKASKVHLP